MVRSSRRSTAGDRLPAAGRVGPDAECLLPIRGLLHGLVGVGVAAGREDQPAAGQVGRDEPAPQPLQLTLGRRIGDVLAGFRGDDGDQRRGGQAGPHLARRHRAAADHQHAATGDGQMQREQLGHRGQTPLRWCVLRR